MDPQTVSRGPMRLRPAECQPVPSAEETNRRGIARLKSGDATGALQDFRCAAALDPGAPEPWNNSGLVRQLLGQLPAALTDFDRALALWPDYPDALGNRGRARQALGDIAGARADFDRALEHASDSFAVVVLHNRGLLRQQQDEFTEALADFDRALALDPGHTPTRIARGLARKEVGDLEGALADFDAALGQKPADGLATLYHGRGGVHALRNDFRGALADYDRALALDPEKFNYYISRGNARYHRRDPGALIDFRMAFRLDAEGAARELLRILARDARGNADSVLENCTKHLRLSDGDVLAAARRGLTLLLQGREAEAEPDLARCTAAASDLRPHLQRVIELARSGNTRLTVGSSPALPLTPHTTLADAVFVGYGGPE